MYADGMTIREIAAATEPGVKVQRIVERYIAERRPPGPRDQSGEKNPLWKGSDAGYSAMHLRVEAVRGKPAECAACDGGDPDARYHWANMTGHYEDIFDFIRLCPACHIRFDSRRREALGHGTMPAEGGGFYV
jgi:hypothetical protein